MAEQQREYEARLQAHRQAARQAYQHRMSLHRFEDDLELGIQEARVTMLTKRKKQIERRRSTVAQIVSEDDVGAICAICSLDFEPGDKVNVFACQSSMLIHIISPV